jgi:CDP-diacylglycerol--glycerol-3-phosphate 3-phosphatidyltransferase
VKALARDLPLVRSLALGLVGCGAAAAVRGQGALPFLAAAGVVWLVVVGTFGWLRAVTGERARVGVATTVTLSRGWLIGALAGLLPDLPREGVGAWAPGILYTAAAVCDLLDGYLARRRGEVTKVGARLDTMVDGLGLMVGSLAGVGLGRLPVWYLALGLAYYLFHGGLLWRGWRGLPVHLDRMRPSLYTRQFAGCQMGLVATALFPVLGPPGTTITAALFMTPSLALFVRDWLVVTGRLDPDRGAAGLGRLGTMLVGALPRPLRLIAGAGLGALVGWGALSPLILVLAAFVALGVLTRLSAFAAAVGVALLLSGQPSPIASVTFTALVALLLTGAGQAALFSPEDRLMLRRAGEATTRERR